MIGALENDIYFEGPISAFHCTLVRFRTGLFYHPKRRWIRYSFCGNKKSWPRTETQRHQEEGGNYLVFFVSVLCSLPTLPAGRQVCGKTKNHKGRVGYTKVTKKVLKIKKTLFFCGLVSL